jgi:hypothetical protein
MRKNYKTKTNPASNATPSTPSEIDAMFEEYHPAYATAESREDRPKNRQPPCQQVKQLLIPQYYPCNSFKLKELAGERSPIPMIPKDRKTKHFKKIRIPNNR